jgi:hypothetical protein
MKMEGGNWSRIAAEVRRRSSTEMRDEDGGWVVVSDEHSECS